MANFVQIQSSITIKVTTGLQNKNVTNPDAHVPDRLKINPEWPKCQVLIKEGAHNYPAEIAQWPTVKALAADKKLTIGAVVKLDKLNEDEAVMLNVVNEAAEEFKMPTLKERKKSVALADLANDEE